MCKYACKNACLFICLFVWVQRGRFGTQVLLHITQNLHIKLSIFTDLCQISSISGTSGHVEMGGHPWVTKVSIDCP